MDRAADEEWSLDDMEGKLFNPFNSNNRFFLCSSTYRRKSTRSIRSRSTHSSKSPVYINNNTKKIFPFQDIDLEQYSEQIQEKLQVHEKAFVQDCKYLHE